MSYDRVQRLENIALRSQWFTRPHIYGEAMLDPLEVYEGGSKGILQKQLQSTRERLELPEGYPLIVADLGSAYGIAVAQLNQMRGVEAFGIDQYRYPDINSSLRSENLIDMLLDTLFDCIKSESGRGRHRYKSMKKIGIIYRPELKIPLSETPRKERHIVDRLQRMKHIPDMIFDFLISSFTLTHLPDRDIREAVREIDRILTPKGGVLLSVGEETKARIIGNYFSELRNVRVLYDEFMGNDSMIHFEY